MIAMTWIEKVKSIAELLSAAWRWVVLVLLVVVGLLLVRACDRADQAEAEIERVKEAAELEREGFLVAERQRKAELEDAVSKVPALQAEIDRLAEKLGRKPKIVTVERIVTAPAPAEGTPRPAPATGQPCPDCLFAVGDTGQIVLNRAQAETRNGNDVVIATGECWRLTPTESLILSGIASAPLSRVSVVAPPSKSGWGGGVLGGVGSQGWIATGQLIFPPLIGDHLSPTAQLSGGAGWSGPHGAIQGGILWR